MELRHLRYFAALAERLHFTQAASKVHVTQSTLSHQIRQLEDELGQQLVERMGKRVVMTEAGELFLAHATRALSEIDQGIRTLKAAATDLTSEVRIAATHTFCIGLLPTCLAAFLQKYPSVRATVEETSADTIYERLRTGRVDIGVIYRPAQLDDLRFEPLYNEEMVLAVAPNHPLAAKRRIRLVELHNQRVALLSKGFATRQILDDCFRSIHAEPVVVAEMNSVIPMLALARKIPIGVIVSEYAVSEMQGLHVVKIESPTPFRTPGILWNRAAQSSTAVRSFVATIRRAVVSAKLKAAER